MELLPIINSPDENTEFINNPMYRDTINQTLDFYKSAGFMPPWISYFAMQDGILVGFAAFKGQPMHGTVEIAYGTIEKYRNQGIGTELCKALVDLSLKTDPAIKITARTYPEHNFSTRILKKNNFEYAGIVHDPEDGDVWEWEYQPNK